MAAPVPSICPGCCVQTEPSFVPPKKATRASGCPAASPQPCCQQLPPRGRGAGQHLLPPQLQGDPNFGAGWWWKDIASNVRFAKPAAGWDGEALEGMEIQDPWDAERVTAAKPMAVPSQLVPAGLPGRRLSLAGPKLHGEARLGKPSAPRAR